MKRARFCTLILALGLYACGTSQPVQEETVEVPPFPYVRLAPSAPPRPMPEILYPPANPMREVWRAGHWDYDGRQFNWVEGQYMERPHPTAAWTPDRWERRTFGWAFVPGFWQ
ncbi:MAG: hypothetical protein FWF24_05745 [Alphaproteobacteria bacterium]|nr:hypothetical protein [Alphaproteobacteria bacterium]